MIQKRHEILDKSNKKNQTLLRVALILFIVVLGIFIYQQTTVTDNINNETSNVTNVAISETELFDAMYANATQYYQELVDTKTILSFRLNPLDMCLGGNKTAQAQVFVVNIEQENIETKAKEYKPEYLISGAVDIIFDANTIKGYTPWIDRSPSIEGIHELALKQQMVCEKP